MDLALIETGNGGDIVFRNKDLAMVFGFENMPYMALFGGNPNYPTTPLKDSEQAFDWWGNRLLFPNDESKQFNSLTEQKLKTVALNSSGRIQIEESVKQDLKFMSDFANLKVSVSIISDDKVLIELQIVRPDNLQKTTFIYIWDKTLSTITIGGSGSGLQENLQFQLMG